jgi:hypothetical protein
MSFNPKDSVIRGIFILLKKRCMSKPLKVTTLCFFCLVNLARRGKKKT